MNPTQLLLLDQAELKSVELIEGAGTITKELVWFDPNVDYDNTFVFQYDNTHNKCVSNFLYNIRSLTYYGKINNIRTIYMLGNELAYLKGLRLGYTIDLQCKDQHPTVGLLRAVELSAKLFNSPHGITIFHNMNRTLTYSNVLDLLHNIA